ncbi:S1 family peptidase [Lentzea roselyniae]|uniref:S1 family peptidase n=1 Tax=Lentzea roselyniae TaxID=531940 RepID=A0ABP7B1Y6_9PSEU
MSTGARAARICLVAATASLVLSSPATADALGDEPTTATAVAVITQDPHENDAPLTHAQRTALASAFDRAAAHPAELSVPYVANGKVVATATPNASAEALRVGREPYTVPTAGPDLGSDDGTIEGAPVQKEEVEPNPVEEEGTATLSVQSTTAISPNFTTVKYSVAELEAVRDEVLTLTTLPDAASLVSAYVDASNNRVLVETSKASGALRAALAAKYGSDRVALYLRPDAVPLVRKDDRKWDGSPFAGGSEFSSGRCTKGFGWVHQGKSYILTAGHCTSLNETVSTNAGSMGKVTADNWNNKKGSVKWNGQSYYSGDLATIKMPAGKASSTLVYKGGPNSDTYRVVTDKWGPSGTGDRYCVGGQVTGEMCGFKVIASHVTAKFADGEILRAAHKSYRKGKCTVGGDSGGPIYTIRSDGTIAAKGILSGGSSNTSGNCYDYFTDTHLAEKALAGVLRVKAPK